MNITNLLFLTLALLFLSACTNDSRTKKFKIVFSQCVQDDAWRETMLMEMKRELSFHPELEFEFLNAEGNSLKQIDQLNELLNQPFDLLIVSPNESEPLTPIVNKIFQKGLPIVVVDRKTSSEFYTVYIGSDNYQIGKLAAEFILKDYKKFTNNNILYITGLKSSSASIEREKGFMDTFKNKSKAFNIQSLETDWRPETALEQIKTLSKEELNNLSYIFCFNDRMAVAISDYLKQQKLSNTPKIIGVDGLALPNNGLDHIRDGKLTASLLYPTGGKETIQVAKQILEKEDFKRNYDLGTVLIDTSNVNILLNLEKKLQSQHEDIDKQQRLLTQLTHNNKLEKYKSNILFILLILSIFGIGLTIVILIKLNKSKKTIVNSNVKIKEQYSQLSKLNEDLNTAFNARVELFKNLSYSLQNPIAILISIKNELLEQSQNKKSIITPKIINTFNSTTNRLLNISTDIQHLENIELGSPKKQSIISTDINQLISQVIYQLKNLKDIKSLNIKIKNNLFKKQHYINQVWVERGLFNLCDYLFKVASFDRNINIILYEKEHNKNIIVFDIKIGPFKHQSLATALEQELGMGIGVIFFHEVIKQHGGNIKIDVIDDQFHILIEIEELEPQLNKNRNSIEEYRTEFTKLDKHQTFDYQSNKNILLIDHDSTWAELLQFKMAETHKIYSVHNFEQAIEFLKNKSVDLIITEIKLHQKQILDYTEIFQNITQHHLTPMIIFTNTEDPHTTIKVINNFCSTIILKKNGIQTLVASILRIIQDQQHQTQKLLKLTDKDLEKLSTSSFTHKQKVFIEELDEIISQNINDPKFNVNILADKLNISRVNLYKKCLELLNQKPSDYIIEKRINKALYLLKTDLNISEVAYQSGFTTPAYFSKVFSNIMGLCPKEYKKINN